MKHYEWIIALRSLKILLGNNNPEGAEELIDKLIALNELETADEPCNAGSFIRPPCLHERTFEQTLVGGKIKKSEVVYCTVVFKLRQMLNLAFQMPN